LDAGIRPCRRLGDNAVLTLRTGSYAGPVLGIAAGAGFAEIAETAQDILFGSNHDVSIVAVEAARYAP